MVGDYKTIKRMYETAGKPLADKIRSFCGKDVLELKVFFYYPKRSLDFRSIYELCLAGKHEKVLAFLNDLEHHVSI